MSFTSPLDLNTLALPLGIRIDGQAAGGQLGDSGGVASAGDLNGDGYADFVVSARGADNNGRTDSGSAYVIFGKAFGFADVNLANLGTQGFRIDGQAAGDLAGYRVGAAGDVNGDGFADLILSAQGADNNGRSTSGSAYVVFGKAAGFTNVDLANLGTQGVRIDGAAADDLAGTSADAAGDVNGDGFADIIIGARQADNNGRSNSGSAYVVFGKASGFANVDLATLGTQGFRMDGAAGTDLAGTSATSAGDVNGDGFADVIIGANLADANGRIESGSAYVVFGRASGLANIDLAALGTNGFRIDGATAGEQAGLSAASAGDVNGDGFGDIIIGAYLAGNNGRANSGSAYVVFGKAAGFGNVDLASLGTQGFRIDGSALNDFTGLSVASAGDVNGDGFADLLVSAFQGDTNGRTNNGAVYLIFGRASGLGDVDLAALGSQGVRINGAASGDQAGLGVASAGDVNGDGRADVLVGGRGADNNARTDSGSAYLLFGQGTGSVSLRGTTLADSLGGGAGDDRLMGYGQDDRLFGRDGNDTLDGGPGNDLLDGGNGNDLASYASATAGVTVSLGVATAQNTVGAGTDTLASIEDLLGSAFDDTLTGNGGFNVIEGGLGNDVLDGGAGFDVASYAGAPVGVTVSLALATPQNTVGAGTDTLTGFEGLRGSAFADTLTGNAGNNMLQGGGGNDRLTGGAGDDEATGGAGIDTAVFSGNRSAYGFTKNIDAGWTVSSPGEGTDTLISIERAQFADQTVSIGFVRTEDMAGRGFGDLLFQNLSGGWLYRWQMEGPARTGEGDVGGPGANWAVAGKGDFNGDGNADLLWRNAMTGQLYVWLMDGGSRIGEGSVGMLNPGEAVGGVGDTDGDGKADIFLRGADGGWNVQRMDGISTVSMMGGTLDAAWNVASVADFNGDLKADVLWRNGTTGQLYLWQMNGSAVAAQDSYATPGSAFVVAGAGDLDGDGRADVVIKHATQNWFWGYVTDPSAIAAGAGGWLGAEGNGYALRKIADYTGDDKADLLFYEATNGYAFLQSMNGLSVLAQQGAGQAGAGFAIL